MIWQALFLLGLMAMLAEAGREAWYDEAAAPPQVRRILRSPAWWAQRRSGAEKRAHLRYGHIDLLARQGRRRRK